MINIMKKFSLFLVAIVLFSCNSNNSINSNKLDPKIENSITTILSKTKDIRHLKAWQQRVGEKNAERITRPTIEPMRICIGTSIKLN